MGRYHTHRSDANADVLIDWLEQHGASVARSGRPTDVIVGYRGLTVLVEIKTRLGRLRASQRAFLLTWRGAVAVIRTTEEATELLVWMRDCAEWIPEVTRCHKLRPIIPYATPED